MKNHYIIFTISLFALLLTSCRHDPSPAPLKFNAWENNPVISKGEPGSWEDLFVFLPHAFRQDNVFYLFYSGMKINGKYNIGLATSTDGYHFSKFGGNPVFASDNQGFDAYGVGAAIVLKEDSVWVMYYNAAEIAGYGPGPYIGRATAKVLTGPWTSGEAPVLTAGSRGEWDAGFVVPNSILEIEDGSYMMYYTGGADFISWKDFSIGIAFSSDGIKWKKYNDPATTEHPFKESDPVLKTGDAGEWDCDYLWTAHVSKSSDFYEIYYMGSHIIKAEPPDNELAAIGYATSKDGIHWEKYR
ncbi:MAG: hypothetical protein WC605_14775, partial [Bacteroidales bacterium]